MVYKIRIILDAKEDIFRDVEIKDMQTLWNLHLGIKSAFSLSGEDLSIFNILEDDGVVMKSVPLEDMSDDGDGEIMSDIYLHEAFPAVGSKVQFQYGFMELWEFFAELLEIQDEKPAVNYPITVFRFGKMPLKAPSKARAKNTPKPIIDDVFGEFEDGYDTGDFDDEEDTFDDEDDGYDDDFFEEDSKEDL
ncbi:IS1096 element passenger TnpR family protein [Chryseobacterium sp. MP_3.2]|uniref:IS1096 element passenger TnpR family protein n=1 Tax=Chryseobacterium sp. MP_3.2 TaxID=3071712 RepID=UPI002DFC2805|nr:hypothetical protein [Chryseobacterium sp. MP_3.2]